MILKQLKMDLNKKIVIMRIALCKYKGWRINYLNI